MCVYLFIIILFQKIHYYMKCIYFMITNNSYYITLRIAAKNLIGCYHHPISNPVNNGPLCSQKKPLIISPLSTTWV